MNVLFICNQNQNRSKTAEQLFRNRFNTKSAGLFNQKPVTQKELEWADIICVMEDFQRAEIGKRFPEQYLKKKIISLNIPDTYLYNEQRLINALSDKIKNLAIH